MAIVASNLPETWNVPFVISKSFLANFLNSSNEGGQDYDTPTVFHAFSSGLVQLGEKKVAVCSSGVKFDRVGDGFIVVVELKGDVPPSLTLEYKVSLVCCIHLAAFYFRAP